MKIRPEQEVALRDMIRETAALDPRVSIRRLQAVIEQNTGHSISDKYVMKLLGKVRHEMIVQTDRGHLVDRCAEIRERNAALRKHLYRIIYWKPAHLRDYGIERPTSNERVHAIKTVAQMDLALMKTELYVGLFEDKCVSRKRVVVHTVPVKMAS
jgi:hypothetical protein